MSLVAVGLAQEFLVHLLDNGVLVRLSVRQILVCVVQNLRSDRSEIHGIANACRLNGLTAAVYTAAGARHNLNKVSLVLAALNTLQQLGSIAGAAGNRHSHRHISQLVLCKLDALGASDILEVHLFKGGAENCLSRSTESSLHNAAGCAEDSAGSGADVNRLVELLVCKSPEVDSGGLNKSAKLSGGNCNIHIHQTIVGLTVATDLKLLSRTGDSGYEYHILGVNAHLLAEVGLIDSAEHLLRRLAGGEVFGHFGEIMLAVLDPSG